MTVKTEQGFTPGPWTRNVRSPFVIEPVSPSFDAVATVQVSNRENWEANARLIAAAPELYEALEEAREAMMRLDGGQGMQPAEYLSLALKIDGLLAKIGGEA